MGKKFTDEEQLILDNITFNGEIDYFMLEEMFQSELEYLGEKFRNCGLKIRKISCDLG